MTAPSRNNAGLWAAIVSLVGVVAGALAFAATDRIEVGRLLDHQQTKVEELDKREQESAENQQEIIRQLNGIASRLDRIEERDKMVLHRLGLSDIAR